MTFATEVLLEDVAIDNYLKGVAQFSLQAASAKLRKGSQYWSPLEIL